MKNKYTENNIRVVTAREAVRLRPSMYLEEIFKKGNLNSLPIEVLCHAIDEYYDNNCSAIEITLYKNHFSVKYDSGLSLSTDHGEYRALAIMTSLFACRNHKKHLAVGEEFCQLGIATVNFCSEYCKLKTVWNGKEGHFKFEFGELIEHSVESNAMEKEFTEIVLKPDPKIFGDLTFSFSGVKQLIESIQNKLNGLTIKLYDATNSG